MVRSVRRVRLELYLGTSPHFCSSNCNVIITMLGHIRQKVNAIFQRCVVICIDMLDDGKQLFRLMATSGVLHIYIMAATSAPSLLRLVRRCVWCSIALLRHHCSAAITGGWTTATTTAATGLVVRLRAGWYFRWPLWPRWGSSLDGLGSSTDVDASSLYYMQYMSRAQSANSTAVSGTRTMSLLYENTCSTIMSAPAFVWTLLRNWPSDRVRTWPDQKASPSACSTRIILGIWAHYQSWKIRS